MAEQVQTDHEQAEQQTITMEAFVRAAHITMTAGRCSENPNMDSERGMDHWKVTLRAGRSRMTTYFSMGYGHKGKAPEVGEVLDCLASDASSVEQADFADWCRDLGYTEDSRRAERTYKACEKGAAQLRRVLGDSAYETLLYHVERL